jgi:alkanesulfonate monooxygenase SsuD/methylene tetrahydromethanopterin reductase-like flavin-dependent oxidoreductase (luciferase family)
MPSLGTRFRMLEETLQMAHAMWSGDRGSGERFEGRTVTATRLLNSPQALSRPRVPIMIGGGGERKTLRLVAQYADATNVFGGPEQIAHKYAVLREHCDELGRPYDEIQRSVLQRVDLDAEEPARVVERFAALADAGAQMIVFSVRNVHDTARLERVAREILEPLR